MCGDVLAEGEAEEKAVSCGTEMALEVEQLVRMAHEPSLNHINNWNRAVLVHIFSNFL
jgi:hypothetical protein